jgi:hypothetical protein
MVTVMWKITAGGFTPEEVLVMAVMDTIGSHRVAFLARSAEDMARAFRHYWIAAITIVDTEYPHRGAGIVRHRPALGGLC